MKKQLSITSSILSCMHEITEAPESVHNIHESCFKSYHTLKLVKNLLLEGYTSEQVLLLLDILETWKPNQP